MAKLQLFYDDALKELVNHYANLPLFLVLKTSDFMIFELIFARTFKLLME